MPTPLLNLLAQRPQLLAERLLRCGELIGDELSEAASQWQRRLAWQAAAAGLVLLALVLAGVAAMLAAGARPEPLPPALWLLPVAPGGLALVCLLAAGPAPSTRRFAALRERLENEARELQDGATQRHRQQPRGWAEAVALAGTLAAQAGRQTLQPLARRHPYALVGTALAGGALLAWARPWRALPRVDWPGVGTQLGSQLFAQHGSALLAEALAALQAAPPSDAARSYTPKGAAPTTPARRAA